MQVKKTVRSLHLFLGLASGIVVFIVALSGSIYAFEKEIRDVVHADVYKSASPAAVTVPVNDIINNIREVHTAQKIRNLIVPAETDRNIQVNLKNKVTVFADARSGKIAGELDMEKELLAVVLKLHRQLCLGEFGKKITGASVLIFFIMLVSGIILWWPKSKRSLKHKTRISFSLGARRLLFDVHNVLGFYASWILLFTVLTGLIFSYKWAEKSMYFITGSKKVEMKFKSTFQKGRKADLHYLLNELKKQNPGKQILFIFPEDSSGCFRAAINYDDGGFFNKQDQYFFDQYSGEEISHRLFSEQNTGEKLRMTNLKIHTGKVLGTTGEVIVFFSGLIAASLPVTGFLLWWGKRKKKSTKLMEEELGISL